MHNHVKQDEILNFWFGEDPLKQLSKQSLWFAKESPTDDLIRDRFEPLMREAASGAFDDWAKTMRGALAHVILCDQFPRNVYRDTDDAFALDHLALRSSQIAIDRGFDQNMTTVERCFLYLPLEHSEDLVQQDRAVGLFQDLDKCARDDERVFIKEALDYAVRHREIIAKFGRFPHRNEILGRASTREEREFLKRPGSTF